MSIGIIAGNRRRAPSGPPFDPLSLAPAVWLDPTDSAGLWQDIAASVPAAVGSPVARLDDKSGNGRHAVQPTPAKRPVLRAGGGRQWIEFDGQDDCLQIPSITLPAYLYVCAGWDVDLSYPLIEHSPNANPGQPGGFFFNGTSDAAWLINRGGSAHHAMGSAQWLGTSPAVAELHYDGAGEYRRNGALQANGAVTGAPLANSDFTSALNIGSRDQAAVFFGGKCFGLLIAPPPAAAEQANCRKWMGARMGLSL